ncbi:hypothetical protein DVR12_22045 [Chitinophaga silvatica]|uniref:Uncharacterized protein n=1 Tax=Chitinophaga silvatica TaxID=2282649 RepID=A0A3E1Y526_9BACT|nr:hypothetical protein [Chitinophaga silvatica]RFS19781.1 hypothetical protein DVR12_22045 [Chitinophaga silvatica]
MDFKQLIISTDYLLSIKTPREEIIAVQELEGYRCKDIQTVIDQLSRPTFGKATGQAPVPVGASIVAGMSLILGLILMANDKVLPGFAIMGAGIGRLVFKFNQSKKIFEEEEGLIARNNAMEELAQQLASSNQTTTA